MRVITIPTVHPAVFSRSRSRSGGSCCEPESPVEVRAYAFRAGASCGSSAEETGRSYGTEGSAPSWQGLEVEWSTGGGFGVRRPLRFLAYKLGLDEAQVTKLAQVLDELKTERAQAAVDDRRTLSAFADGVQGQTFDAARIREGAALRAASAERLNQAVLKALERIHALLNDEQRERFAYLIRTGTLQL